MNDQIPEITAALEDLQRRMDAVERAAPADDGGTPGAGPGREDGAPAGVDPAATLWLVEAVARRSAADPADGGVHGRVVHGGRLRTPGSGEVAWQLEHPAAEVLAADLDAAADVLAALGHPVRLQVLRLLLQGAETLAELAPAVAGTTGQLHHHLRELRAAGLVTVRRRGHYEVPTDRVVPVLVIVAAALGRRLRSDDAP